jgi:arylsulfatase A-like enzyme
VAHPGERQFGNAKMDVYDGEIAYTDKHIGKLLDFLARSPAGQKTVIIVTSDHGDGFKEHGFENHGFALYRELVHVPLLFYVPENEGRVVPGPVSNIDIMPTLADLIGVDIGDPTVEGESLIPQIFYGATSSSST